MHTNTIESNWYRVKRWLPGSGRYDLNSYLPVFLWTIQCRNRGLSTFAELLKLLAATDMTIGDLSTTRDNVTTATADTSDKFPCLYCPQMFTTMELYKEHFDKCKSTPNTDTVN